MSKKAKPQRQWEDGSFFSQKYLDEESYQKISSALQLESLYDEFKEVIQIAVSEYCAEKQRHSLVPRQIEVRAALREIKDTATKLIEAIEQIDTISKNRLEEAALSINIKKISKFFNRFEKKYSDLHFIEATSQEALDNLAGDLRGRPNDKAPLRTLILNLLTIYKEATRTQATITWNEDDLKYGGIFFNFVSTILQIVDPIEIYSNSSLGQQIRQSLKWIQSQDSQNIPTIDSLKRISTIH